MNIILLERIEKLGQIGDLVTVKSGYARNFLLPQGKAVFASKENIKIFEDQKVQLEGENIEIYLNDISSPALIKDPSDFDSIFVIMPMKG